MSSINLPHLLHVSGISLAAVIDFLDAKDGFLVVPPTTPPTPSLEWCFCMGTALTGVPCGGISDFYFFTC